MYNVNSNFISVSEHAVSFVILSEVIHLPVVMGWAGNIWDPFGGGGSERPGGSGAPACPNTQPCGLCD